MMAGSSPTAPWSSIVWSSIDKYMSAAASDRTTILDGGAWRAFLARLARAGDFILEHDRPASPIDRADAFHQLLIFIHFAIEHAIGDPNPRHPTWSRVWPNNGLDMGAANPDGVQRHVPIRGHLSYRLHGRLGTAAVHVLQFFDGEASIEPSLDMSRIEADADGHFELVFSSTRRPGQYFEIDPATIDMFSREFFDDWETARPALMEIECLDAGESEWPVVGADRVTRELEAISGYVEYCVRFWHQFEQKLLPRFRNGFDVRSYGATPRPELKRPADSEWFGRQARSPVLPEIYYGHWDLEPDECLLIEAVPPVRGYWGIQLTNRWWGNLNYIDRQTSLNRTQAHLDDDGVFRAVLAHEDPGVQNWLDTLGHRLGVLLFRMALCDAPSTAPTTQVVKFAQLRDHLRAGTPRVDAGERRVAIARRREQSFRRNRG